jgi:hypothetical protein
MLKTVDGSLQHGRSLFISGVVGEAPPREEPVKPFGLVRQPTVEEELGYRQPFTAKEREFSHHAIQVRVIFFLPVLRIRDVYL